MLELYYFEEATCGRKARLVLAEKAIEFAPRKLDRDAGELRTPEYLALNPNGYVPTLVHDGHVITESTIVMTYLDEVFPDRPLRPADPLGRARVAMWLKWPDEKYLPALGSLTYATGNRDKILSRPPEEIEAYLLDIKDPDKRARRRDNLFNGIEGEHARNAVRVLDGMVADMERALAVGPWLAGEDYTLAECAITPFMARIDDLGMSEMWTASRPRVTEWWARIRARESYRTVFEVDADQQVLARLRSAGAAAWPTLRDALRAA